jgi:hypothetical protein
MDAEEIEHELEEVKNHMAHPHEPYYETYEVYQDIAENLRRKLGEVAEGYTINQRNNKEFL